MQNNKYSKVLTIVLVVVVIIIILLLIFWGVSVLTGKKPTETPEDAIARFENSVISRGGSGTGKSVISNTGQIQNPYGNMIFADETYDPTVNAVEQFYQGFPMLGYIEIPKINVKLPILSEISMPAMEASICRFYGPELNEVGNVTLAGHNYKNGTFFSDAAKLSIGDGIFITGKDGQTIKYVIYEKYQTTAEDSRFMTRDITPGTREISLTTCGEDSSVRTIILAKEATE